MSLLVKAGSFVKPGTAAPFSQAVTGIGFQPKGVFLFASNAENEQAWATGSFGGSMATFTGTNNPGGTPTDGQSYSVADTCVHNLASADELESVAQNAYRIHNGANTGNAFLTSLDSDGFTLQWGQNQTGVSRIIHYLAIGGSSVKAKTHNLAAPTSAGNKVVTGVGFRPDLVLFLFGNEATTAFQTVGVSTANGGPRLGAMDRYGNQWAQSLGGVDNVNPSNTERAQLSDCCLLATRAGSTLLKANYVSMDADGYTLNFSTAPSAATLIGAIAIAGVTARVGVTPKPTSSAPATHAVTGIGFRPKAVFLASVQAAASSSITDHAMHGMGAATGTSERTACCRINRDNVSPTNSQRYSDSSKAFVVVDNGTPSVDAAADLASFDPDGFTLTWNPNHGTATEVVYIAIGDPRLPHPAPRFIVPRRGATKGRRARGAWRRRAA